MQIILVVFVWLIGSAVAAEIRKPESQSAISLKSEIIFDGIISETVYSEQYFGNFTQREPNEGKPATENTFAWVLYDKDYIYISAKLKDSEPDKIDRSIARRDSWVESDWFVFYVDPYNDNKTGYFFATNPGGSMLDGVLYNDSWDDNTWDGIWESKCRVTDEGWETEIRIPINQLRFRESENMVWGVNFERRIKRKNESAYFVMVPKKESGFVSHFAKMDGLTGIKPSARFEALPYIVQKAQYLQHDSNDPFYSGNQYRTTFGGDFKIGLNSSINLDLSINPDFGQVEVDPAVLNLSAFETYYEEKRPFFVEGASILQFGFGGSNNFWGFNFGIPNFFYSRRIGRQPQGSVDTEGYVDQPTETRILGAAKITGKINDSWSLGSLSSVTERTYAEVSEPSGLRHSQEIEPLTHYGVFRTKREFGDGNSSVGFLLTTVNRNLRTEELSNSLSKQAYVFGVDGWTFLDNEKTYVITGVAAGSYVSGTSEYMTELQQRPYRYFQRPDAGKYRIDSTITDLSGWFSRIMLNKQKGNFYVNAAIGAISPGFEYNDLGLQGMGNRINGHLVLGYRWFEPDSTFRSKSIYISHFRNFNFEGNAISNGAMLTSNFQFLNYYGMSFQAFLDFPYYSPTFTRGGPIMKRPEGYYLSVSGYSDNRKPLVAYLSYNYSSDRMGSYGNSISFDTEWHPATNISVTLGPSISREIEKTQWVIAIDDSGFEPTFGKRYIFGELSQTYISATLRINYAFSPSMSLQAYLQPFFAVGNYSRFKQFSTPSTMDFMDFGKSGSTISFDKENDQYNIRSAEGSEFSFSNPDFNFKSFRANLIFRWEVQSGSVLYLVWTHSRANFDHPGDYKFGRDFSNLFSAAPDNIFLAKFSYWFNMF